MAVDRGTLRDWHRLFGLLLTDFFTGTPFTVEVERDLSVQQQLLDVVIVRRGRGRFAGRLPDGLEGLVAHNLVTFKSHHEALDSWAIKELVSHYVAYRKLVSPSPSNLLPEEHFGVYAVCARTPHNLSALVPWQGTRPGVYDCRWGTDTVRVIVAGELRREAHNAPLHLFSASPGLVGFASSTYQRRSEQTSLLINELFEEFRLEGFGMTFTMEDFKREVVKKHFGELTSRDHLELWHALAPEKQVELWQAMTPERRAELLRSLSPERQVELLRSLSPDRQAELLQSLPPEQRLAGLSPEVRLAGLSAKEIKQYLDRLTAGRRSAPRKPRRKKS